MLCIGEVFSHHDTLPSIHKTVILDVLNGARAGGITSQVSVGQGRNRSHVVVMLE